MARVLSSVHAISTTGSLCWTSMCAACLYVITRPDSQFQCTRVYIMWFPVAWGSATLWWQSNACNCSMLCTCTQSGSPHNVMHFLVYMYMYNYHLQTSSHCQPCHQEEEGTPPLLLPMIVSPRRGEAVKYEVHSSSMCSDRIYRIWQSN